MKGEKRVKCHKTVFVTKADPFELHINSTKISPTEFYSLTFIFYIRTVG